MTYDETRDSEQLAVHEGVVDKFICKYKMGRALSDDAIRKALPTRIRRMMPRNARRIIEDILKRPYPLRR